MKKVLAIDMGATSIRGILAYIKDEKLHAEEVMRYSHSMIEENGRTRWDFKNLIKTIVDTIKKHADEISMIGIDTWGVDFALIDNAGELISNPITYRDAKHIDGYNEVLGKMSEEKLFSLTGTQIMSINTLFQLLAYRQHHKEEYDKAKRILMMPDLINYMLTKKEYGEETIWSTSQILDLKNKEISSSLVKELGLREDIFPEIIKAGKIVGSTKDSLIEELREYDIKVCAVCGHDTASAALLTKIFEDRDYMFLSCGTWSLFGIAVDFANLSKEAYKHTLTNELAYNSQTMFFKNITGLYLLEKFKKQLENDLGKKIEFDTISEYVTKYIADNENISVIDMDYEEFGKENVIAKVAIDKYLKDTKQELPKEDMEYFAIIYNSLVSKYLKTKKDIESIVNKTYKKLHMIGGGAKSKLLCQLISNKLGVEVMAGPFEASALGNILIQLKAVGEINDIQAGINLALKSEKINFYNPEKR